MGEQFTGIQGINSRENENKNRLDEIIKRANDEYNNLFRSVQIGGNAVMLDTYTELEDTGLGLTDEMRDEKERWEAMSTFMKEEIKEIGIRPEDTERYQELIVKQNQNPESISEEEFDFVCTYIRNIDKLFRALQMKDFKDKKFTPEEIAQ